MKTKDSSSKSSDNKPAKKKQQSFPGADIGTPQVPLRKRSKSKQDCESLSDWEDAS
jgi:hypothetical protein